MGTKTLKRPRLLVCLVALAAALLAPQAASASSSQLTLLQDDRELLGLTGEDPTAAMSEIRALGVDVIRTNVIFFKIYKRPTDRKRPAGFRASNPNSPQYDWSRTDQLVNLARANGMKVLLTVTGPGPNYTSPRPRSCPGKSVARYKPCTFRPNVKEFGGFAAAVAKRYRGKVEYYAVWNEGNIGKTWLTPRFQRTRSGLVDTGGAQYRKLWIAGYKAIAKYDPGLRNRVLFGETAAIASPLPFLRAALCLKPNGKPFTGRLRALHGCSGRVSKLNIGGFAIHPYNQGGGGVDGPRQRSNTKTSLPLAYMPRLHRLMDGAARRGRIPRGKGIFITEFGFQSNPPDTDVGVPPETQARFLNESDRLFFADGRVKSVAQYELTDVPQAAQFNTGLRFVRGAQKPAYAAFRLPIVVTRRSADSVEVYGQVRPASTLAAGPLTSVAVQVSENGGAFTTVTQPSTNSRGIFRVSVSRPGASNARWRLSWQNADNGQFFTSRVASAGQALGYYKN